MCCNEILIEAESFEEKGGWVVDQQSMEVIHSAYLMAHGMGIPVANASTGLEIPVSAEYRVWVLTRDWTAQWGVRQSPGLFSLKLDGSQLGGSLGNNGAEWAWQFVGCAALEQGTHALELCDLTGFNGRCDAIYLSDSPEPPGNSVEQMDELRQRLNWKQIADWETEYDMIVVGGGIAGICTALSASRNYLKTLLIQDRPVLGGCNSSEIRVSMGGQIKLEPYPHLGDVVRQIAPAFGDPGKYRAEYFEDFRKLAVFENDAIATVRLNEAVTDIQMENGAITAVICTNTLTGKKTRIRGGLFSDCSGDGILARLAGASCLYGKESKGEFGESLAPEEHKNVVMGHSIRWYSQPEAHPVPFPDLDWKLDFREDTFLNCRSGDWEQETGFRRDMVRETEYIRDYGLRAIYANWSYQKNHAKTKDEFANDALRWVSALGGKRESIRILGDYVLTQQDLEAKTSYPDGTAAVTWGIDIHLPETENEQTFGEAFRSFAYHRGIPKPCLVPYRCLYARDVPNLFLGGRLVSATHIAFSAIRVMRTLGMLGEVVGIAAGLCKKHGCQPRQIYTEHLEELKALMKQGVWIPDAFACGEISDVEKYHFKDLGWWYMNSGTTSQAVTERDTAKFKACLAQWQFDHMHPMPEKWK